MSEVRRLSRDELVSLLEQSSSGLADRIQASERAMKRGEVLTRAADVFGEEVWQDAQANRDAQTVTFEDNDGRG